MNTNSYKNLNKSEIVQCTSYEQDGAIIQVYNIDKVSASYAVVIWD